MVELLPCSKCRAFPEMYRSVYLAVCQRCGVRCRLDEWNRLHGAPLTLAEKPQDVPALDVDEPSVGDHVLHAPVSVQTFPCALVSLFSACPGGPYHELRRWDMVARIVQRADGACVEGLPRGRVIADTSTDFTGYYAAAIVPFGASAPREYPVGWGSWPVGWPVCEPRQLASCMEWAFDMDGSVPVPRERRGASEGELVREVWR